MLDLQQALAFVVESFASVSEEGLNIQMDPFLEPAAKSEELFHTTPKNALKLDAGVFFCSFSVQSPINFLICLPQREGNFRHAFYLSLLSVKLTFLFGRKIGGIQSFHLKCP